MINDYSHTDWQIKFAWLPRKVNNASKWIWFKRYRRRLLCHDIVGILGWEEETLP